MPHYGETPPAGYPVPGGPDHDHNGSMNGSAVATAERPRPAAPMSAMPPMPTAPVRVCPNCSTQTATGGSFCPHCGGSYERKTRPRHHLTRRGKVVLALIPTLLLLGGGATGVILKLQHDRAARHQRAEAALLAQQQADAKRSANDAERVQRRDAVTSLEKAITKDAQNSVATGVLTGPILHSSCTPVSGSPDSLSARSGTFECLAANKTNASDGTESGYRYSGTVDYDTGSITWHLGG
jgi:cell division protein FtsB